MNNVGRILLMVGAVVLALLVGVLIGRGQRLQPAAAAADAGNAAAMQITTAPPPSTPPPAPLPAPVQAPQPASAPKVSPEQQVQDDAAAVGMTTRDSGDQAPPDASAPAPTPKIVVAPAGDQTAQSQPNG